MVALTLRVSQTSAGCATFDELKQDNVIQGAYTCSPPGASSSSPPTSSIFPETTSTPPSGDSSSSLSTGAKVAIGVCVPVAVTALSALLFFWWRRGRLNANGGQVHDELTPRPELAGSPVTTKLKCQSLMLGIRRSRGIQQYWSPSNYPMSLRAISITRCPMHR